MKPFRRHVAIAIDGGGIRGVMVARALAILEQHLGKHVHDFCRLLAGTSTGSIISAAVASGMGGEEIYQLYTELGLKVFQRTLRSRLWPITHYRYPGTELENALLQAIGPRRMGDFWTADPPTDVVITTFDLVDNHTRFVKPWKEEYAEWPVVRAIMASSAVPTYFPVVEDRYVDGGVGSYANPAYLAAYEAAYILRWEPAETTLISLGTGREPHQFDTRRANDIYPWQWLSPLLGAFMQSADDQQIQLVRTFFTQLDFRRFQVKLHQSIPMDDARSIPALAAYGEELGYMILADKVDPELEKMAGLVGLIALGE